MRSGRIGIVAALIVSLLLAGATRQWALNMRGKNALAMDDSRGTSLANMNSFSLALLLGGLRGPLVMMLWIQSENLKNEKNLEDFDTYVEWIRLLQPEFSTVHIFQVWNKAYNISVQMASWANKYATILDAIEYAQRVLDQKPGDINMTYEIGRIYFDKLGSSSEKEYYKRRVREESLPHRSKQKLTRTDPGWRRFDFDPVLDEQGNILPELLKPKNPRPADLPKESDWNDGSELQYLAKYQPLKYGASTFAHAYNYFKQAQVLQEVGQQRHANHSELVLDSRPATALKGWSEDEWEQGRRLEMKAFNAAVPAERRDMEMTTANLAPDAPFSEKAVLEEAIFSYDLSARLIDDALPAYEDHLRRYSTNFTTYQSHMDGLRAQRFLVRGDRDFLKAMLASGDERKKLLESASAEYKQSISENLEVILRYYLSEDMARHVLPAGITRYDIDKLTPEQRLESYGKMLAAIKELPYDADAEDRGDYQRYIDRAQARLARIAAN